MCSPQAAMMGVQGLGGALSSRNDHRNQMAQMRAQQQSLADTNERQRMLRDMERRRQQEFNQRQMAGFDQSLTAAQPENIQGMRADAEGLRRGTAQAVRDQTSADVPLPGGSIPGSGGMARQAMRSVGENLSGEADQLASATAAMQGLPAALSGLGELLQPGATQIGVEGTASQRSRSLLPAELDAARIAPRMPAPRSNILGQLLQAGGGMGMQALGIRRGQQQAGVDQTNDILATMFPQGVPGMGFRAAGTPQVPRPGGLFGGGG